VIFGTARVRAQTEQALGEISGTAVGIRFASDTLAVDFAVSAKSAAELAERSVFVPLLLRST